MCRRPQICWWNAHLLSPVQHMCWLLSCLNSCQLRVSISPRPLCHSCCCLLQAPAGRNVLPTHAPCAIGDGVTAPNGAQGHQVRLHPCRSTAVTRVCTPTGCIAPCAGDGRPSGTSALPCLAVTRGIYHWPVLARLSLQSRVQATCTLPFCSGTGPSTCHAHQPRAGEWRCSDCCANSVAPFLAKGGGFW